MSGRSGDGAEGAGTGGAALPTLLRYELLQILRDKRTLLIAGVAPLVLFPLLILLSRWAHEREEGVLESARYEYAVTGPAADAARRIVRDALVLPSDSGETAYDFVEKAVAEPDSLLRAGGLHLVVRALPPDAYRAWRDSVGSEGREGDDARPSVPVLVLAYRSSSELSRSAQTRMADRLRTLRMEERAEAFRARGFSVSPEDLARVESVNLASAEEEGGAMLALVLTPLLVMLMIGGGTVVAADAISGERERGTLETLLTTAATRREIVWAKLLSIMAVGVAVTAVNTLNLLAYLVAGVIELPPGFAVAIPTATVGLLFLIYLPVAMLVAGVLLLLSGYAGSYKEYQLFALPLTLLFLVPSAAAALPGIELRSAVAAVPLAGVSVAVREVLVGTYDWAFLTLAFISTSAAAGWTARLTTGYLSTERLISSAGLDAADLEGGPALFPRHVLRWFGGLWVALLLISFWAGTELGIRGHVAVNLLGLFLGGSLIMLWRYRLPVKEALALRAPHPAAWLAVLVGVPSAHLTEVGVARLADLVFPVPEELLEAFGQFLLPEGLPLWQILLFLCVLPGICEEIAFRGVLLYGLRRKLRPVGLALAVGAIFGLFHVDLFRIVPTAYLGVVLTASVLLTGSIFPAMVWHALNNALALGSGYLEIPLQEAPASLVGLGAAGLAVSFWIFWRTCRPYPGLRRPRRPRAGTAG